MDIRCGDEILYAIGKKLLEILGENSLVSRYSNDYFGVIFNCEKNLYNILHEVVKNIEKLRVNDVIYDLSVNIGIYKLNKDDDNISVAIDKAIIAHSASKGDVTDKYHIYDEKLENKLVKEDNIEKNMENALLNGEFKVYYQPKIYAKDEKLYGAEALVRWFHDGKMISPGEFIPLFEKNRFILKLDLYIFEQVCKDMKKWKIEFGFEPIVSVNISRQHFIDKDFLEKYLLIISKYGVNPNNIDLEITESAAIDEGIDIINIMERIKKIGFLISIDDFGTGYSSLSMLQDMPIDILKIDKSFVDKINANNSLVDYIINISKELKLVTIAEGVETEEQKEYLKSKGCDIIQGYYYSKPLSQKEFEEYFSKTY